jgi:hypothetical protein
MHIQIYRLKGGRGGFMKYADEMGSVAMIYVPYFINIGSGIQKLVRGIHWQADSKVIL